MCFWPSCFFLFALLVTVVKSVPQTENATNCTEYGALRLVGENATATAGTVEICLKRYNSTSDQLVWGTVCDAFFGHVPSQIACRQLGYPAAGAVPLQPSTFGQGSGPIHLGHFDCDSTEQRIVNCTLNQRNRCIHNQDAGLNCTLPCAPEGDVRLTGGDRPSRGTVWVCINGAWSTVCDNFWGIHEARVVCTQLGYDSKDAQAYAGAQFGEGFGPILLNKVKCDGGEKSLSGCSYNISNNCNHSSDAGVDCLEPSEVSTTLFTAYTSPAQLLTSSTILTSLFTTQLTSSSSFISPSLSSFLKSLTQSLSPSPAQTTILPSVNNTKILSSSYSFSSNRTASPSTIFVKSTYLSNSTTTTLSNFTTYRQSATSSFEFTSFFSPSSTQAQLTTLVQMHNYTYPSLTEFSRLSTSTPTSFPIHFSSTKSLTKTAISTTMLSSIKPFNLYTKIKISTPIPFSTTMKSLTQSTKIVISTPMPSSNSNIVFSSPISLAHSTPLKVTSASSTPSFGSILQSLSQLSTSTRVANPSLTTGMHLTSLKSIFSAKQSVKETIDRSSIPYTLLSSFNTTMTSSIRGPSYALFSPPPSSLPSSIPGEGSQLSLSVTGAIFGAVGFVVGLIICVFVIITIMYLFRKFKRRGPGRTVYDLTSEVTPITAKRYGDTCIHIDIQSQDGDSVNSLIYEGVCPTTETEQLELKPMTLETAPARPTGQQETSHSIGTAPQRKDSDPPKPVSDRPLLLTGASLQEVGGDDAGISAEEMEMRGLTLSSSDEEPLYSRSPETTSGIEESREAAVETLEIEREHKPTFSYQQL